ncbi:MAG: low-specificity L-threonine aldolase [Gammaproteobacteria bacterium]
MTKTAVDLRSDTVTRPTPAMREAMARAPVGDDVYGEDPTVRALEERAAALLGKESAAFFPSGTQANLAALLAHCGRGDEYITGGGYHVYAYEAGGAAVLGGVSPCPVAADGRGGLPPDAVLAAIKNDDPHYPRTRLLCLENTAGGIPQEAAKMNFLVRAARKRGLRAHLDGARLMNAAVALKTDAKKLSAVFDSVSMCLSKGLGAPAGTVLCGGAAFMLEARRCRKILGGGMRQAGILAAAGLWALENNIERLREDHKLAKKLARGLAEIAGKNAVSSETNMAYFTPAETDRVPLFRHWKKRGILAGAPSPAMRLVTHLDVSEKGVDAAISAAAEYYGAKRRCAK